MVFNSLAFIVFILFFIIFFYRERSENVKYLIISTFSLLFYAYWKWEYTFLIILSGLIDFVCGAQIYKSKHKKKWLYVSLITNLGILFSFKYFNFFIVFLRDIGMNVSLSSSSGYWSVLPIGISFYTFQSMSYTIDIYRGHLRPTNNFLKFFSYLSMFPQLVAGPIVRARDVLDQLKYSKLQKGDELYYSLKLIVYGMFKKTVIADGVAKYVNVAFARPEYPESSLYWWSAAICFGIQIYCDFSGYSDIARGLARMFGIHFPLNFNHPYTAISFKDFWSRWHISLSTWFRDYVYIPLGGSRGGRIKSDFNMWMTMFISGLWHGANYTFLVWGAIHSFCLSLERVIIKDFGVKVPTILHRIFVLAMVSIAWVYFRAENVQQANNIVLSMLSFSGLNISMGNTLFLIVLILIGREVYVAKELQRGRFREKLNRYEPVWVGLMAAITIYFRGEGDTFIYFQF